MGSSPGWLKRASVLSFFGVKAVVFAVVAEYKKPLSGKIIDDGSMDMCELPRLSVAMGSLSLLSLLLTVAAGHIAVLYPYTTNKLAVPRRALFQKASFASFFLVAELVSVAALAMLFWTTVTQHAFMPVVQDDGTLGCPATAKTDGMFGGGALLALDATLMWFVCLLMSLEARAGYIDLHGDDDDDEGDLKKKLDVNGDDDIDHNGNSKKLDLHGDQDGNNEEHVGRDSNGVAYAEQSMILSPSQSAAR